jgi:acetyl-CoA carboxylase biotin carboxyl carrier protein
VRTPKIKAIVLEMIELTRAHGLDELEVEVSRFGRMRVRIARNRGPRHVDVVPAAAPVASQAPALEPSEADADKYHTVRSPMVGKFYRSPSPDLAPYVGEGDLVSSGQVLCIIEAMKIMNEIESDVKGKVVRVLVENAQPVEFHQPLFLIEPE